MSSTQTDWRALCGELAEFVARLTKHYYEPAELLVRARAALAQPEPEVAGPSDWRVDVLSKAGLAMSDVKAYAARTWPHAPGEINDSEWQEGLVELLIGALDELGLSRPAPVPAGEAGELVAWLRMQGEAQKPGPNSLLSDRTKNERHAAGMKLTRAAELLEQRQAAPVPVVGWQPISTAPKDGTEVLASDYDAIDIVSYGEWSRGVFGWTNREMENMFPAWWQPLPDHLPLPSGEVE